MINIINQQDITYYDKSFKMGLKDEQKNSKESNFLMLNFIIKTIFKN